MTANPKEAMDRGPLDQRELLELWRESLLLPECSDLEESALEELSRYFKMSRQQARERCLHWVDDSIAEWEASDRRTEEGLLEFYRTTQSWIFDTVWYHAHQYSGDTPAESVMIAHRLNRVRPGHHLDFGSGPGSTSLFFSRLGWQVSLADISTSMLNFARWRLPLHGVHADYYDLSETSLPVQQFDLITACDVLVHVPDPRRTLRELHRALKPGGLLIFNVDAVPKKTRDNQWHLYRYAYPVLRPVRGTGFQRLPRLEFFHVYRKIGPRSPLRAASVALYDLARYNRLIAIAGNVRRSIRALRK